MRDLWLSIAQTSGVKIYGLIIGIVSLGLTARWLGPEGRGQFAAIVTWVTLFGTLGGMSLGQVAIHRASTRKDAAWLPEVLGSLGLIAAAVSALGWSIAAGLYPLSQGRVFADLPLEPLVVGFLALPFYVWEQYGTSLLIALDRVSVYNRFQILGRTSGLIALFLGVLRAGWGVTGALLATLVGQVMVSLGGSLALLKQAGWRPKPARAEVSVLLKGGLKLHFSTVGTLLFASANILMINYYRGAEETGFYQLAVQLIGSMLIVPQSAGLVMYAKVTSLGADEAWPLNRQVLKVTMLLMLSGAALAWILAPWLIPLIAGEKFRPAVEIFRWLLPSLVGMAFSTVMAAQWIGRGLFWQAALVTLGVGVLNLGACVVLIPRYGMLGAVAASSGSYLLALIINAALAVSCSRKSAVPAKGGV